MAEPEIKPRFPILNPLQHSTGIWFNLSLSLKNWNKLERDLATEGDLESDLKTKIYKELI